MSAIEFVCHSVEETQALANRIASYARAGDCITLVGEVGAGKTTFAQGFIAGLLAAPEDITSPTFNIVYCYDTMAGVRLWHVDLYRLKAADELEALGLEEAFASGIALIEWPEIARDIIPQNHVQLSFFLLPDGARRIEMQSNNSKLNEAFA